MNKENTHEKSTLNVSWHDLEVIAKEVTKKTLEHIIENPNTRPPYVKPHTIAAEVITDMVTDSLGRFLGQRKQ